MILPLPLTPQDTSSGLWGACGERSWVLSGQYTGMLLHILKYTEHTSISEKYLAHKLSTVLRLRNPFQIDLMAMILWNQLFSHFSAFHFSPWPSWGHLNPKCIPHLIFIIFFSCWHLQKKIQLLCRGPQKASGIRESTCNSKDTILVLCCWASWLCSLSLSFLLYNCLSQTTVIRVCIR